MSSLNNTATVDCHRWHCITDMQLNDECKVIWNRDAKNMECNFKHYLLLAVMVCCSSMLCLTPFLFFPSPFGTNIFLGWTFLFLFLPFLLLLCFTFSFVLFYFAWFLLSHSFALLDILRSFDFVSLPLTKIQQQIVSFLFQCVYNKKLRKVLQKQTKSLQFLFRKRALLWVNP